MGQAATLGALLVGLSTLFAKQHYILDVIAGALLAGIACAVFLRGYPREQTPELDRRLAPVFALGTGGIIAIVVACCWVAYRLG